MYFEVTKNFRSSSFWSELKHFGGWGIYFSGCVGVGKIFVDCKLASAKSNLSTGEFENFVDSVVR